MSDTNPPFVAEFTAGTADEWRERVDKILKGADFDKRLVVRTADGIAIQPLYTASPPLDMPMAARGTPRQDATWDIRQLHADHDAAAANAAILDDLKGGVTSIMLQIAAPGSFGLDYHEHSMARALDGVMLDVCPIALRAGEYTPDCAGSLMALWRKAGLTTSQCQGAFNYDPLGTLALTGSLYQPLEKAMAVAAELVRTAEAYPGVHSLLADGQIWHAGGASEAQEMGLIFATVIAYLRAAEAAGIAPNVSLPKIAVSVAVDTDQFLGVAKLRALRIGLARIAEVCGAGASASQMAINATTATRMMSKRDPWVNLLRTTMACTAAAMGSAKAITVLPFTWPLGRTTAFAQRIARNTHIVLQEESGLGRVQDPAGGSYYVEQLTTELAAAAWTTFQDIERQGGLGAALLSGTVQSKLADQARQRAAAIATGKFELTGTSTFPRLGDDGLKVEPWPLPIQSADLPGARATPLSCERLPEPFERLRDAADCATLKPRVFLATLGPLAQHAARATWMRNFLAAGGIEAVGDEPLLTSTDAGRAFAASGCTVACLCAADATYAELGEATATLLKTAGAKRLYLAGRQKDDAALRTAGVDDVVFAGGDMIATLNRLHTELGIKAVL